ncbi:MAG TPA: CopG family transcriptional regulator [Deltaproteobacteria bacterium]|nr:MAG: hypothetical protein A2048_02450 [Deltaproteobacteria bacterium GWA2_45_12]HBF12316.1 CopG family transcriptional regulator [Deltaproteobacteria bacterium]
MKKIPDPSKMKRIKGPVLSKEELARAKIRITTNLDKDVLEALRDMALQSGNKYQTILNQALRAYLLQEKNGILERITRLEKAVFKS